MQDFQKDLHSLPIMTIAALTMTMASLMFLSFFLTSVSSAI